MAPHQQPLEDPFVDMPAMPSPTRRGSRPPLNPFGLSAPLLKLQPPSPETSPHPPELLPPPVIHAGTAPGSHDPYSRSDSPSSAIPLWTPDSPSAAHPNLPPPPSYDSPLARTRTRSNEDPTAPSFASPFADTRSLHSLSSEGSAAASPPRRPEDRKFGSSSAKARGFVVLNGSTPSFLETGTAGKHSALSSEEAAARRRRNQKLVWGGMAGGLCLVLALLVSLAVGVGVGVVRS